MPYRIGISSLDTHAAVRAVNETLRRIDERLMDHGERVAYIACELADDGGLKLDRKLLHLLCAFHDIGAYKTDEIDRMVEFETHDVNNHSIYGYLFMKYLTPLHNGAEAILFHHTPWEELKRKDCHCADYAALIHLADRIDIALMLGGEEQLAVIRRNRSGLFNPAYVKLLEDDARIAEIKKHLISGVYLAVNAERIDNAHLRPEEALEYLKMVVYSIDFRSEYTVTHTINTVAIALSIARAFGLSDRERESVYLGALLHDVGKVGIPFEILENPGRLSDKQMEVMRTHVTETEKLISGVVPDDVLQIAVRHHEKLDGSGYPKKLTGKELDLPQRIVAVADIVSALGSRRSYKEAFPKEKTLAILSQMAGSQLDPDICRYICGSYDELMQETDLSRNVIIQKYQSIMQEYKQLSAC